MNRLRVIQLWRYPVKSMAGEAIEAADVLPTGLEGDRRWGVVDVDTGRVLTARREPRLLFATARLRGSGAVEIILPGGRVTSDDAVLSSWLGRPVALERAGTEGGVYENPSDFENEADWVSWQGPSDAWHDSATARVSLLSRASLGAWDVRRFRPNVVIDGAGEEQFVGRTVKAGAAELDVNARIARCIMVTRPQPGIPADLNILRTINKEQNGFSAVGASIRTTGCIAVGDELTVSPP